MRTAAIVTLALLVAPALAADVYRTIDAQGNIVYSDRPEDASAVRVAIRATGPTAAPRAPTRAGSPAETSAAVPDQATLERAEREQRTEDRAGNCAIARERNETYSTSRRLYRVAENGERTYLDDAELSQARLDAQAAVAQWCD